MSIGLSGQRSDTETATTIAPQSASEARLAQMLRNVAGSSAEGIDFEALAAIASGDLSALSASAGDRALIESATGASSEIASRRIREELEGISRQIGDRASGRGIEGSSIEAALEAIAGKEAVGRIADVESERQGQTSQALLNLPFQRAGLQLGANQQLFNQLVSASSPVLEIGLRERLAQANTQTTGTQFGATADIEITGLGGTSKDG